MNRWRDLILVALGVIAIAIVVALAFLRTGDAARGWMCAFVLISMIPIGSLALLLVNGITGGRWGADLAPVLVPAARCTPLLILAFLPVLFFRPLIYPWPAPQVPADVAHLYLNPLFFDVRTLLALIVWSILAWTGAWRTQLFAGIGLAIHLILTTFIPADWVITIQLKATSAGFGMGFGIEQIFAGLAFAAILAPQGSDPRANRDLAGIMVSALLGTVYFLFVAFLIIWYGNIPEKVSWYALRAQRGWAGVAFAAFIAGAAIPFLQILSPYVRSNPGPMRVVGAVALTGIALHIAWLMLPAVGTAALLPAIVAALAMSFFGFVAAEAPPIAGGSYGA